MNDIGAMVNTWWLKLVEKFPVVETDPYVIMPNHVHGIVRTVGADQCVRPDSGKPMGVPLPKIVQWFKTMTANEYMRNFRTLDTTKLWPRNY